MLRSIVDDEYLPEFSTLVVRDDRVDDGPDVPNALTEHGCETDPGGTIAVAGAGWLNAAAGGTYQEVRLEAHDVAPREDLDGWLDVVESPYLSTAGSIGLSYVTYDNPSGERLQLGAPGAYRVRVGRRPHPESGDNWRLQFWPDPDVQLPRWLMRTRPVLAPAPDHWSSVLDFVVTELPMLVSAAANGNRDGATVSELEAWCAAHGRPLGWLEEPLWPEPPRPAPTGHADLDAAGEERVRTALAYRDEKRRELDGVVAQLGLASPADRHDLLKLLTTIGLLDLDENTQRYRAGQQPRRVLDVLDLPADRARAFERGERVHRYRSAVADLVAVVRWSPDQRLRIGRSELAELLVMPLNDLDETIRFALGERLLSTETDESDVIGLAFPTRPAPSAEVPAMPAPEPPIVIAPVDLPRPISAPAPSAASVTFSPFGSLTGPASNVENEPAPEPGPPPRAGIVGPGGGLVVWRDGEPVNLATPRPRRPARALETGYETVLLLRRRWCAGRAGRRYDGARRGRSRTMGEAQRRRPIPGGRGRALRQACLVPAATDRPGRWHQPHHALGRGPLRQSGRHP